MADFGIDPTIPLGIKPTQNAPMTIADFLQLGRQAQAYGQSQALNPLILRQQQAATELAEKSLPLELERKESETILKNIESAKASTAYKEQQKINAYMQDPRNYLDESNNIDLNKINKAIPIIAPQTGAEHLSTLTNLANNNTIANNAKLNFNQNERSVVASVYKALGLSGEKDPKVYVDALKKLKEQFPESPDIQRYADAATNNLLQVRDTSKLPSIAIGTANQLMTLPQLQTLTPTTQTQIINGVPTAVVTTPSAVGAPPAISIAPVTGTGQPVGTMPSNAPATKEGLVPLDMPAQNVANPILNTYQQERYVEGNKDYDQSNQRQSIARDSQLAVNQIKQSLSATAGSKGGQIIRSAGQAFFGNPELDTLVKNLAEQQVRQAKLMGVNSVNAENDLKAANGSENISAEALAHIVQRAEATNLAAEKYNQALTNMQAKYGRINARIHNDNFKRTWANNYDPVAFIIQSTNRSNIPQKAKDTIIDYYTSGMSNAQLQELAVKQKNLKRLERGDF